MINVKSPLPALWILGTFLLAITDLVVGQRAPACNNGTWDWSYNSKGQNPCLVAAYLLAPCRDGQYNLPPVEPHGRYTPPNDTSADNCFCSSVAYSLLATCVACQKEKSPAESEPPTKWSEWSAGCDRSLISISKYPRAINPVTAVPGWAYFDVVTADTFNLVNASLSSNLHESTVGNVPTSTASTSPGSGNKGPDTSLIIGVTVGGVIGVILIVGLVWVMCKRVRTDRDKEEGKDKGEGKAEGKGKDDLSGRSSASPEEKTGDPSVPQLPYTPSGSSSPNQGQSDPFESSNGSPWSPPPTSSTPALGTPSTMGPPSSYSTRSTDPLLSNASTHPPRPALTRLPEV